MQRNRSDRVYSATKVGAATALEPPEVRPPGPSSTGGVGLAADGKAIEINSRNEMVERSNMKHPGTRYFKIKDFLAEAAQLHH